MSSFVETTDPKVSVMGEVDDEGQDNTDVSFDCWPEGGGCGRKGTLAEMLIHEDTEQFYCPQCGGAYCWIWD